MAKKQTVPKPMNPTDTASFSSFLAQGGGVGAPQGNLDGLLGTLLTSTERLQITPKGDGKRDTYVVNKFVHMLRTHPNARADWLGRLYSAGYYSKGAYDKVANTDKQRLDSDAVSALESAIKDATLSGMDLSTLLEQRASQYGPAIANLSNGGKQVQLTSPQDLRAVAMKAGQEILGQYPDDAFINRFVTAYQSAEAGAQNSTGTITAPANATNFAEDMLRQQNPGAAAGQQQAGAIDTFRNLVAGTNG